MKTTNRKPGVSLAPRIFRTCALLGSLSILPLSTLSAKDTEAFEKRLGRTIKKGVAKEQITEREGKSLMEAIEKHLAGGEQAKAKGGDKGRHHAHAPKGRPDAHAGRDGRMLGHPERAKYEAMRRALEEAVRDGKITREEAGKKFRFFHEKIAAERKVHGTDHAKKPEPKKHEKGQARDKDERENEAKARELKKRAEAQARDKEQREKVAKAREQAGREMEAKKREAEARMNKARNEIRQEMQKAEASRQQVERQLNTLRDRMTAMEKAAATAEAKAKGEVEVKAKAKREAVAKARQEAAKKAKKREAEKNTNR